MAEEHRGSEDTAREIATRERSFDDLVKVFASGTVSRRRLLGVMGKALVGSVLVSIPGVASSPSVAVAQDCETVCDQYDWVEVCVRTSDCRYCTVQTGVCRFKQSLGGWACCKDRYQCVSTHNRCCQSSHGSCTGSTLIPWRPPPTRCATSPVGFTKCCTGWNQYPWIRECDDGTRTDGCGFCVW